MKRSKLTFIFLHLRNSGSGYWKKVLSGGSCMVRHIIGESCWSPRSSAEAQDNLAMGVWYNIAICTNSGGVVLHAIQMSNSGREQDFFSQPDPLFPASQASSSIWVLDRKLNWSQIQCKESQVVSPLCLGQMEGLLRAVKYEQSINSMAAMQTYYSKRNTTKPWTKASKQEVYYTDSILEKKITQETKKILCSHFIL